MACLVAGCATALSPATRRVLLADQEHIRGCQPVAAVHGSSGWGNLAASISMHNAKNEAHEQAAAAGATHIVFTTVVSGYSPFATGTGYRCP